MKKVNEKVIIATDQAMIKAGLIKCSSREGLLRLWVRINNRVLKKWEWTPIMRVFVTPLTEDVIDGFGIVIEPKSTHKIACFYYGAVIQGKLDLSRFLEKYNVTVEKL